MPKILVSDYDGTLYTNFDEFKKNIEKIKKFINNGNIFIIATGRNYLDIIKQTKYYKIPYDYIICNDGGTIFDKNDKLIYKKDIPDEISHDILNYLIMNNLFDITYIDTGFDYTKEAVNNINAIIVRDINREQSKLILKNILVKFKVTGYISDNWINITEQNVNKANAIKYLRKKLDFDKRKIYTIGNTINDISMIKEFDGACVKNATEDLKCECTKIFNSVAEYIDYIEKE